MDKRPRNHHQALHHRHRPTKQNEDVITPLHVSHERHHRHEEWEPPLHHHHQARATSSSHMKRNAQGQHWRTHWEPTSSSTNTNNDQGQQWCTYMEPTSSPRQEVRDPTPRRANGERKMRHLTRKEDGLHSQEHESPPSPQARQHHQWCEITPS